ncbi:ABC transporter permease [Prevotella sp. HUN102]|uniref:ABC transporter permease n=1 Tax=Prevotella sp. HUN102 TaxID=1392486 RepID=UPI00048C3E92|nr:ABC transporter permease [Prevotella sp. HUN102]
MNSIISFIIKESRHIVRDRRTMLILFGMPVVQLLLLGFAVRTDIRDVRCVIVTSQMNHSTRRIIDAIDASSYFTVVGTAPTPNDAKDIIRAQQADIAIVFAPHFGNSRQSGDKMQILVDGSDPNMAQQYVAYVQNIIMQRTHTDDLVTLRMLYNPQMLSAYNFVPGIMGIILIIICTMMTSISIVKEKENGTMEVLLVSPVNPLSIIIAKTVPYFLLGNVLLTIILLVSHYILKVPFSGSLFWIVTVALIYIFMSLALGLLISNLVSKQIVALLLSAVVMLMPCIMLSGFIFPIESMPSILQWTAYAIPITYFLSAMRKLMIMGVSVEYVLPELAVLIGMTLLFSTLAIVTFKKRLA